MKTHSCLFKDATIFAFDRMSRPSKNCKVKLSREGEKNERKNLATATIVFSELSEI